MRYAQVLLVDGLENLCTLVDRLLSPLDRWWYRRHLLAEWSAKLDDRWHTGRWHAHMYDTSRRCIYCGVAKALDA